MRKERSNFALSNDLNTVEHRVSAEDVVMEDDLLTNDLRPIIEVDLTYTGVFAFKLLTEVADYIGVVIRDVVYHHVIEAHALRLSIRNETSLLLLDAYALYHGKPLSALFKGLYYFTVCRTLDLSQPLYRGSVFHPLMPGYQRSTYHSVLITNWMNHPIHNYYNIFHPKSQ